MTGCKTYTEAAGLLDVLCTSLHEGHRCRYHWQSMGHLQRAPVTDQIIPGSESTCCCACGIEWATS